MSSRRYVSEAIASCAPYVISGLCGFVLTPILFHQLQPANYAILVFASAVQAMLEGMDIGLFTGLVRFTSALAARQEYNELRRLFSSVFYVLAALGATAAILIALLSPALVSFFQVGGAGFPSSALVLTLVGASLAFQLPSGALDALLFGYREFKLVSGVGIAIGLFRAGAMVALALAGFGLLAVAAILPAAAFLRLLATLLVLRRLEVGFVPRLREVNLLSLRRIWRFSLTTFAHDTAIQWFHQLDTFLACKLLALPQVAVLAVARRFPWALMEVSTRVVGVAFPSLSAAAALHDRQALEKYVLLATRGLLSFLIPLGTAMITWAEVILRFWVGTEVLASAGVFRTLVFFAAFFGLSWIAKGVLFGLGRMDFSASVALAMPVAGILLGIPACTRGGLLGLAVAFTSVQAAGALLIFWQALRLVDVEVSRLWEKSIAPVLPATLPTLLWFAISYRLLPHTLGVLLGSITGGFLLFFTVLLVYRAPVQEQTWQQRAERLFSEID